MGKRLGRLTARLARFSATPTVREGRVPKTRRLVAELEFSFLALPATRWKRRITPNYFLIRVTLGQVVMDRGYMRTGPKAQRALHKPLRRSSKSSRRRATLRLEAAPDDRIILVE